jgi:hypothetical protein
VGDELVLPLRLARFIGSGGDEYGVFWRERHQWFRNHGINPRDWPSVSAILRASEHEHSTSRQAHLRRLERRGR